MTTASATASSFLRWGTSLACALVAPCAWAQTTPGQIPNPGTYQGSMQLQQQYDQQQQQFRNQQQQQQQQADQQWNSTVQQQQARQNADMAQAQQVLRTWQKRPPLAPGQNPLLGRWDSRGTSVGKPGRGNNDLAKLLGPEMANMTNQLLGGMTQGLCDSMLGRGLIEFRPNAVVAIGRDGREQLKYHVQYRGGGSRVVVLPQDAATFTHMIIDFESPDRAFVDGVGCAMVRAGGAAAAGAAPQGAAQLQTGPVDVAADVVAAKWESAGSTLKGEADFYVARSTIHRSGQSSRMWEMIDFRTAQSFENKPFLSSRSLYEYDCRRPRRRMLAASAYTGHLGKGSLVGSEFFPRPSPWEPVVAGQGYADHFLKVACAMI